MMVCNNVIAGNLGSDMVGVVKYGNAFRMLLILGGEQK